MAVALLVTACAPNPASPVASSTAASSTRAGAINPVNIKRVVRELPPGYEVTYGAPAGASPQLVWGVDASATVEPTRCAALADPGAGRDTSAHGVSASGAGGIVRAVVVAVRPGPVLLDPELLTGCTHWTMTARRGFAGLNLGDAPPIDGADTLAMVADIRTSVESGTEIDSRTYTFTAYLGDFYAYTTLTTDPGSALPALGPQFAADLLVKTVAALRG